MSVRHYVDVVVKHPRAAHVLAQAAETDGAAALEGERGGAQRCLTWASRLCSRLLWSRLVAWVRVGCGFCETLVTGWLQQTGALVVGQGTL